MTLVSDIIRDAYRESNINSIGTAPSSVQADEALRLLNRLVLNSFGSENSGRLFPISVGVNNIQKPSGYPFYNQQFNTNNIVPYNARLVLNLTGPQTIYLNPKPQDGQRFAVVDKSNNLSTYPVTVVANGYTIEGMTQTVISTDGFNQEWFFRQDTGDWLKISPLLYTDTFPYPEDFDDYFIVGLAIRLNPRNGAPIDPQSQLAYKEAKKTFLARYSQKVSQPSELALLKLTNTDRTRYSGYSSQEMFNVGFDPLYRNI